MNSFWKITRGELDKIFVRPSIFVMVGFFIIAIVVSTFMFNPSPRADLANLTNIEGNAVTDVYNQFNSNQHKQVYDNNLLNTTEMLDFYSGITNENAISKSELLEVMANVNDRFESYKRKYALSTQSTIESVVTAKNELKNSVVLLNSQYSKCNNRFLQFFITNSNNEKILTDLNNLILCLSTQGDERNKEHHRNIIENIDNNEYLVRIKKCINKLVEVTVPQEILKNLKKDYLTAGITRRNEIFDSITEYYNKSVLSSEYNLSDKNVDQIKTLCDNYKLLTIQIVNIINNEILLNIVKDKTTANLSNYTYVTLYDFNKYQTNEALARDKYYFANNSYSYQYANVFQSNVNSNEKTNAYDFMYFALEFLSFIIVIFCVVVGAGMISGESVGGTMKMLAIRPYRRDKIITGKLMGTFLLGAIFLIIGGITTLIIGARLYGLNSSPVLMIFDATTVSTISPFPLFLIFISLLLVRIIMYTILAVFISTAFKSNVAAVIISVMLYVFIALFGNLFGSSAVYGYLPFANVDLFRFFGGEFVTTNGSILGLDFSCPLQPDSNFYLSLGIVVTFIVILLVATYIIFKRRDIE